MLLIKTPASRYRDLEEKLVAIHPYEVPEVIAVPTKKGFGRYLDNSRVKAALAATTRPVKAYWSTSNRLRGSR